MASRLTSDSLDHARALIADGATLKMAAAAVGCWPSSLHRRGIRGNPRHTKRWCGELGAERARRWDRARIVAAINAWAERYGEPPTALDWSPATARRRGHLDRVERFLAGEWPYMSTVVAYFGRWSVAIESAGWESRPVGARRPGPVRRTCSGTTRGGLACRSAPVHGTDYCRAHDPAGVEALREMPVVPVYSEDGSGEATPVAIEAIAWEC